MKNFVRLAVVEESLLVNDLSFETNNEEFSAIDCSSGHGLILETLHSTIVTLIFIYHVKI